MCLIDFNVHRRIFGLALTAAGFMLALELFAVDINSVPGPAMDNRLAVRTSLGLRSAMPLSAQTVELIFGVSVTDAAKNPNAYRIVSFDDPDYAYEKFVVPESAQMTKEREAVPPEGVNLDFSKTIVVLKLPFPMKENSQYHIVAQGYRSDVVTGGHSAASFKYAAAQKYSRPDNAKDVSILGLREVEPVGNGIIKLQFGPNFSTVHGSKLENYSVSINGLPVKVSNLGRISKIDTYLPVGWPFAAIPVHDVFIKLVSSYKDGDLIEVKVAPEVTKATNSGKLKFDSNTSLTNSIKVNQIGYLPDSPVKVAYLGRWLGSFPEIKTDAPVSSAGAEADFWKAATGTQDEKTAEPKSASAKPAPVSSPSSALLFDSPPEFYIVNSEDGKIVFTGKSSLIHRSGEMNEGLSKVDHSGENVYELLFSEFKNPGKYYIKVTGAGRSLPFEIADNIYSKPFEVQSYGVFAQRCGIELKPPYSEWRRIACHNNGIILTEQTAWEKHNIGDDLSGKQVKAPVAQLISPEMQKLNQDPALYAWFKLDGNFLDSSSNGHKLEAISAGAEFSEDNTNFPGNKVYGPTVQGDRNGALSKSMKLDGQTAWTICGWFKKNGNNEFFSKLFGFGEYKYNSPKFGLGSIWGVIDVSVGATTIPARFERINNDKWRHLALKINPREADRPREFYVFCDGTQVLKGTVKDDKIDGQPFGLGMIAGAGAAGGYFDDIRVYSRGLAQNEIKELATPHPSSAPVSIKASGGHHDAGDYNPRSHIDVAQILMTAYEVAPAKFYDGQLNIPENNNGLPDILDEAFWSIRLWLDLQDKDGGVRNGTESAGDPNFVQTVELDDKGDFAYAKDAQGSFIFAGVLAQAARLWKMHGKIKESDDFLVRARKAYAWAEKNQPKLSDAGLFAKVWLDPKAYAAAELFKTTGEAKFNKDYLECSVFAKNKNADIDKYCVYDQSRSAWAYATSKSESADQAVQDAAKKAIIKRADEFIKACSTMSYKFYRHPWAPINWGTGAYHNTIDPVIWSWKLTGDNKYKEWIIRSCDNTLGANPLNLCYITGLGSRPVYGSLHNSKYCHHGEVAPGMQVEGPVYKVDAYRVKETSYPKLQENMAILQNYVDCHYAIILNEGVVHSQTQTMAVFGMLLPDKQK